MGLFHYGKHIVFCCILTTLLISSAGGISCYQCVSTDHVSPFQCNEYLSSDIDLQPQACDAVFEAQYCVKHTGRFEVGSIDCYQCSAASDLGCSDELIQGGSTSCDHMFEARYCIKTTGFYEGGLGTKRFCSSLDLGNYCNYIKQPGDELEYRSCVFTCSTDGCNAATHYIPLSLLGALLLSSLVYFLQ